VPATTGIYTLSLHDALPIFAEFVGGVDPAELQRHAVAEVAWLDADGIGDEERAFGQLERDDGVGRRILREVAAVERRPREHLRLDRKSTRLNSSHVSISYAV